MWIKLLILATTSLAKFSEGWEKWVQELIFWFYFSISTISVFIQAEPLAPVHGGELVTSYIYMTQNILYNIIIWAFYLKWPEEQVEAKKFISVETKDFKKKST